MCFFILFYNEFELYLSEVNKNSLTKALIHFIYAFMLRFIFFISFSILCIFTFFIAVVIIAFTSVFHCLGKLFFSSFFF